MKKLFQIGWRIAVAALLLGWIFHAIFMEEGRSAWEQQGQAWASLPRLEQWRLAWTEGPLNLWQTVSMVQPGPFLLSLVWVGLTILIGVIRWRLVLGVQGLHLSLGRTAGISLVAQFFNAFLLGSTGGDIIKAYYAARETHHKKTEAVVTVGVDRLMGLWAMLGFACVMMLPNLGLLMKHERLTWCAGLILLMFLGCSGVLSVAFWGGLSRRFPKARNWLRRLPKGEVLEKSLDACRRFGQERAFLTKSFILSMLLNAVCVFQGITLAHGLGLNIPASAMFLIVPTIICISAMPVTPSGLGVRENLFVMMLTAPELGIPAKAALSLSLLTFAGSLFWSVVGGVVYIFLKKRQHLDEVTKAPGTPENGD